MIRAIKFFLLIGVLVLTSCGAKKKSAVSSKSATTTIGAVKSDNKSLASHYATLLHVQDKDLNLDLYRYIDDWMGVPHRLGGQERSGIDCSAFVSQLYRTVYQKQLPRTSRDMANIVKRKYDHQLREGDLVFFSFGGKNIDHVGVYLWNDKFVHVSTKQGVIISNLKDVWYYKYLTRCGTPEI